MDARELQQKIAQLRREGEFQTNAFLLPRQLEELLSRENTVVGMGEHYIAILEQEKGFYRLHYYMSQPEEARVVLRAFLCLHSEFPIVADLVNRPQAITEPAMCLNQIGFRHIETLTRMNLKPELTANCLDYPEVEWALAEDGPEIERLLYQTFNPFVSRLPDQEEILDLIAQKTILVVREAEDIAGLVQFKPMPGQQILLDQILVRPDSKQRKLGGKLLHAGVAKLGAGKRVSLWAHDRVIAFYEKYGFEPEERVDYILLFEGEKNHG